MCARTHQDMEAGAAMGGPMAMMEGPMPMMGHGGAFEGPQMGGNWANEFGMCYAHSGT